MNVLKNPTFFRSTTPTPPTPPSRPESSHGIDRASRPLTKLSLSNFMRQASMPIIAPQPATVPQDASYLEVLGLKLSEAVTKALAQPTGPPTASDLVSGRKPIPLGRGRALGNLISSELNAAHDNLHLYRAVLRSLQKPMTVLLTNLSGSLLPLLASPLFLTVPTMSNQFAFPNPVQAHALAVCNFCEELLQVFEELSLGIDVDHRGDCLRSIRDGLISLVKRIINPLISAIRVELIPLAEALEIPNISPVMKPAPGNKSSVIYHPSIVALQTLMPQYAKVLTACTTSSTSHATLASLLISVLWKSLVALSHRVNAKPLKKLRDAPPANTPPMTPSRFAIKLPPSRPSSPPTVLTHATPAQDGKALYDLLMGVARPSDGQAREAVDEAFEGLRTLPDLLNAAKFKSDNLGNSQFLAKELNQLTTEIPFLISLPVILRTFGDSDIPPVASILGISEEEYRKGCLSGFSRAEECDETVGQRILDILKTDTVSNYVVTQWLETELEGMDDAS